MGIEKRIDACEVLSGVFERLRGLLARKPDDATRILVPCHDIHTFGMRHPIDIAFIGRDGTVLEVHRNVGRRRRIRRGDAAMVAERFAKEGEWLTQGDTIRTGAWHGYNNTRS